MPFTRVMANQPLKGQRVLVTRPAQQNQQQIEQLSVLGASVVPLPMLTIEPLAEGSSIAIAARQQVMDIDLNHHVIFISPNAAKYGIELIDQYWPQLPIRVNWHAIGEKTSKILADYGIDACRSHLGYDSEALLHSPLLSDIREQRCLIMRGCGGRETLADTLRVRGATVAYAELYQRLQPVYSDSTIKTQLYEQPLTAILVSSGETLTNLLQVSRGSQQQFTIQSLLDSHLVVPSARIATQAKAYGFTKITVAAGPDDQSMIETLFTETDAETDK